MKPWVSVVQAGIEAGVIVEQAVKDVGHLARCTGDELRCEDADAVADMSVDRDGLVVMTEVPGIVGANEGARR